MIFGRIFERILRWAGEHNFLAASLGILLLAVSFVVGACSRIFGGMVPK